MSEMYRDNYIMLSPSQKENILASIIQDQIGGVFGEQLYQTVDTSPKYLMDYMTYFESHARHFQYCGTVREAEQQAAFQAARQAIKACMLKEEDIIYDHYGRLDMIEVNKDMPHYENWELPTPSENLRGLLVETEKIFRDYMRDIHQEHVDFGEDEMREVWFDACEEIVPKQKGVNHQVFMNIYESDKEIIDFYAQDPHFIDRVQKAGDAMDLYDINLIYISSGVTSFLEKHFYNVVNGEIPAGSTSFLIKIRPNGYEIISSQPVSPL